MSELVDRAHAELDKRFNRSVALAASNLCARCGLCVESCHYFVATRRPELTPVAKVERIRSVYKRRHDWLSRLFPAFTGARELTEDELDAWRDIAFQSCTMCERCVVNCPPLRRAEESVRGLLRRGLTYPTGYSTVPTSQGAWRSIP